ncbi:MAG: hypothetical protein WCS84_09460, partial [Nocardioides sp.]
MSDQRTSGPDLSGSTLSGIAPPPSLDDILSADHDDTRIGAVDFTTLHVPVDDDTAEPAPEPAQTHSTSLSLARERQTAAREEASAQTAEPEPEPEPEPVTVAATATEPGPVLETVVVAVASPPVAETLPIVKAPLVPAELSEMEVRVMLQKMIRSINEHRQ